MNIDHGDPEELMQEYEVMVKEMNTTRDALKKELMQALEVQ